MAGGTLDDSLQLATTNIGIDKRTIVSENPRSQASQTVASYASCVCGRKRHRVANNSKKVNPWWNEDVKDAN